MHDTTALTIGFPRPPRQPCRAPRPGPDPRLLRDRLCHRLGPVARCRRGGGRGRGRDRCVPRHGRDAALRGCAAAARVAPLRHHASDRLCLLDRRGRRDRRHRRDRGAPGARAPARRLAVRGRLVPPGAPARRALWPVDRHGWRRAGDRRRRCRDRAHQPRGRPPRLTVAAGGDGGGARPSGLRTPMAAGADVTVRCEPRSSAWDGACGTCRCSWRASRSPSASSWSWPSG